MEKRGCTKQSLHQVRVAKGLVLTKGQLEDLLLQSLPHGQLNMESCVGGIAVSSPSAKITTEELGAQ